MYIINVLKGYTMDIWNLLADAKGSEDKKVGFNLQIPASLKEEFEQFCKNNNVSMTAMLNTLMKTTLQEVKGLENYAEPTLELVEKVQQLQYMIDDMNHQLDNNDGEEVSLKRDIESYSLQMNAIENELKRRKDK